MGLAMADMVNLEIIRLEFITILLKFVLKYKILFRSQVENIAHYLLIKVDNFSVQT